MHIVMMTRGIKCDVDRMITDLQGKYFNYGKNKDKVIQARVSPVQLWDVSFPKEEKDSMINTLFGEGKGNPINKGIKKWVYGLRKMMGLEKIPESETKLKYPLWNSNIEMIGIGVKEDGVLPNGDEAI